MTDQSGLSMRGGPGCGTPFCSSDCAAASCLTETSSQRQKKHLCMKGRLSTVTSALIRVETDWVWSAPAEGSSRQHLFVFTLLIVSLTLFVFSFSKCTCGSISSLIPDLAKTNRGQKSKNLMILSYVLCVCLRNAFFLLGHAEKMCAYADTGLSACLKFVSPGNTFLIERAYGPVSKKGEWWCSDKATFDSTAEQVFTL